MKRHLAFAAALAGLGFASAANAASVVMTADSVSVAQGATIILHGVVTSSAAEADNTAFGAITYQDAFLSVDATMNSQVGLPSWATSLGALTCNTTRCVSFSQINANASEPVPGGVTAFQISSTRFVVDATTPIGTVLSFAWQSSPSTQALDYFGVTSAPGITVTVIPEPTTAAMLGLGLLGLALAGRRRG
jgi:hypothetical protein